METGSTWQQQLARAGVIVLISLLIVFLYLMFLAGRFHGVTAIAAMDYAQIAQNLAGGKGYTTNIIRPMSLASYPKFDRHPELGAAPLHPYITSLFMRVMPDKHRAVALACGLGFLLTVPVVFFLGWQLFDVRAGLLATGLYVTNLEYLRNSISGLEAPWATLWICLLFLVLYTLSRKARWRVPLAAASGLLVALAYLTQYLWLAVLPLVAFYIYLSSDRRTRWLTVGVFLLAWVIVVAPWCVRNMNVTGHPFYNYAGLQATMGTRTNPGNTLFRQFSAENPSWLGYLIGSPMEVVQKIVNGIGSLYLSLLQLAGPYVMPFFVAAIMVTLGSATFERLRNLWYALFVLMSIVLCIVTPAPWVLVPLGPLAGVIAAGFFLRLLEARLATVNPKYRLRSLRLGIGVLVAINALPLAFDLFGGPGQAELTSRRIVQASYEVASITSGPVVTDVPWPIAWYADRPAVWLPKTRADLRKIEDKLGKIRWMLLSPQITDTRYDQLERTFKEWGYAYREAAGGDIEFEGYRVHKRIRAADWELWQADPRAKRDLAPEVVRKWDTLLAQ